MNRIIPLLLFFLLSFSFLLSTPKNTLIVDGAKISHPVGPDVENMITTIRTNLGITGVLDRTTTGVEFDNIGTLSNYDLIVIANAFTFSAAQQVNFETWANNGGHVLSIHQAVEAHPHSSISVPDWDYYAENITGYSCRILAPFETGSFTSVIDLDPSAPVVLTPPVALPIAWSDQYYYQGYRDSGWNSLIRVAATGGLLEDSARTVALYRNFGNTAKRVTVLLGHDPLHFSDPSYIALIQTAMAWICDPQQLAIEFPDEEVLRDISPAVENPVLSNTINITGDYVRGETMRLSLYDLSGNTVHKEIFYDPRNNGIKSRLDNITQGIYLVHLTDSRGYTYLNRKLVFN